MTIHMITRAWSAACVGVCVAALAACGGRSPTAPQPFTASAVLTEGESAVMPGTELRVTLRYLITAASIDCLANAPCNLTPIAYLEVKVPAASAEVRGVRLPNPDGGDRTDYGGYAIRVDNLQPGSGPSGREPARPYALTVVVSRE